MINQNLITFCITCWEDDFSLLEPLLIRLKSFFPLSNVFVVGDGLVITDKKHIEIERLKNQFKIDFYNSLRVKELRFGGLWTKRYLSHFVYRYGTPILIKLEPDVIINRPFNSIPENCAVFGSINPLTPHVRGGCIGFYKAAVIKILESEILNSNIYKHEFYSYDRYGAYRKETDTVNTKAIMSCQDRILGHACQVLNLVLGEWSEVAIKFREIVDNPENYAVVSND